MPSIIKPLLIAALILGGIEGGAYWWMHPAASGQNQAVLVYRPQKTENPEARKQRPEKRSQETDAGKQETGNSDQETAESEIQNSSPVRNVIRDPKFNIQNLTPPSVTLLPEIVSRSIPSLHCSSGTAARIDRDDGVTIHLAFFEWDLEGSRSVLEAYKHLPEECMGSIGMKFIENLPERSYKVDNEQLSFTHTVFNDPAGVRVHAFKGVWVSGIESLIGDGFTGGGAQWRSVRFRAALKRFRPAYARVAQGAVRGIANPDQAWQAFEEAMLKDLRMENQ